MLTRYEIYKQQYTHPMCASLPLATLSLSLSLSLSLCFLMMRNEATGFPPSKNDIHKYHRLEKMHHESHNEQHHEIISSSSLLIILIPIIILVLLIAILLLVLMLRRLRANTASTDTSGKRIINNSSCMFIAHGTIHLNPSTSSDGGCLYSTSLAATPQPKLQVQVFTLKEVEMATNKFSESNIIENGASGVVYRGILRDGTAAAFKMLRANGRSGERAFRLEVDLLSRLRSPYICELIGYCADQHHRLLVFEYMANGILEKFLHPQSSHHTSQCGVLSWGVRLKIALDCARALEYLHEHMTPSIIHRNFKCGNILLDQNFKAKLSGFGLAKIGSDKLNGLVSTRVLGTTGYLAPEYASTGKLTTKSDVYSYGVLLLELLTGRVPIDTTRPPGEHVLVSWVCKYYVCMHALPSLTNRDKVMEMIDPALQGHYSKKDLIQVAAIAAMCIQTEADYRPLITDVVQSLMPLVKNHSSNSLRFTQTPSPRK